MPGKEYYKDMTPNEKIVAKHLNDMNLEWYFEHPVFVYDDKGRPRVWSPDFHIPSFNVYVEVCGSENFDYKYRKEIYEKNDIPVIFLHLYKNPDDWQKYLRTRILELEEERHEKVSALIKKLLLK